MTSNDIFDSLRNNLRDRTSSPLSGAVAIAWILWNYKFVLVLISFTPVDEKLAMLDSDFFVIWWEPLIFGIVLPISTALLYLYGYPIPAEKVYEYTKTKQENLIKLNQKIEDKTLISEEQARALKSDHYQMKLEYEHKLDDLRDQNQRVEKILEEKLKLIANMEKEAINKEKTGDAPNTKNKTTPPRFSDKDLTEILLAQIYRLYFNPAMGAKASKVMQFGRLGTIINGKNNNEHSWKVKDGKLELLENDGKLHSRFDFDSERGIFIHTNDSDTKSIRSQYMVPEPR
jgi:hypothetical protein